MYPSECCKSKKEWIISEALQHVHTVTCTKPHTYYKKSLYPDQRLPLAGYDTQSSTKPHHGECQCELTQYWEEA